MELNSFLLTLIVVLPVGLGLVLYINQMFSKVMHEHTGSRSPYLQATPLVRRDNFMPVTGGRASYTETGHFHPGPLPPETHVMVDSNPCEERGYSND